MYTLLVTGDVPGASSYFNPLLQQTIIPCTSGTRPSSPAEGWHIYETDTDRLAKYNGSAWEYVAGSRTSYTPALTASTTNPTLGSGSKAVGWYVYGPGPSVTYSFFVKFGTAGVAAGSGQYFISLPVTAADAHSGDQPAMGTAMIRDNSVPTNNDGTVYIPGSSLTQASILVSAGGGTVSNNIPWTWAASDYLAGTITYPI